MSTSRFPNHRRAIAFTGLALLLSLLLTFVSQSQTPLNQPGSRGVLRLRVRVKEGETTKGLSRKRFFLVKGTLEQNQSWITLRDQQSIQTRDCYYRRIGASDQLIKWLNQNDCESVYCREPRDEDFAGPAAVPEFQRAAKEGEAEFKSPETARKWFSVYLPEGIRDGYYRLSRERLQQLLRAAESASGGTVQSVMTDRNGTAYFTELEPGTYVLTNLVPTELQDSLVTWSCEVQIKPGDLATERPFLVSNRQDRNVKCVGVEKPIPACSSIASVGSRMNP